MSRRERASRAETTVSLPLAVWAGAVGVLAALYATVFALTETLTSPVDFLLWALCNAAPHVLFAMPLVERVGPRLSRGPRWKAGGLAAAATAAYALAAYGGTIFLLALTGRVEGEGLWVRFFQGPALTWQMFQSVAYACFALAVGQALWWRARFEDGQAAGAERPRPQRWLVKSEDGIVPIEPSEIIRVSAEGDYCRLVLSNRVVLSRIGIGECTERLKGLAFLRVHRSHLVNEDAIIRAEPAGNGRIQLSLRNGDSVVTSREGARLVRASAV